MFKGYLYDLNPRKVDGFILFSDKGWYSYLVQLYVLYVLNPRKIDGLFLLSDMGWYSSLVQS